MCALCAVEKGILDCWDLDVIYVLIEFVEDPMNIRSQKEGLISQEHNSLASPSVRILQSNQQSTKIQNT